VAVLRINNKWYTMDENTKPETVVSLKYSYIQEEKDFLLGYLVNNETIVPLIGFSKNSRNSAILITIKGSPLVVIIDDINFDDKIKGEGSLIDFLRKNINV
jgi:hypothetical protein